MGRLRVAVAISLSIPRGTVADPAAFVDGRRHVVALLPLIGLPVLRNAKAMYDG